MENKFKNIKRQLENIIKKNPYLGSLYDYFLNLIYKERRNIEEAQDIANVIRYLFNPLESHIKDLNIILENFSSLPYFNEQEKLIINKLKNDLQIIYPPTKILKFITNFSEKIYFLFRKYEDEINKINQETIPWSEFYPTLNNLIDDYFKDLDSIVKNELQKERRCIYIVYRLLKNTIQEIKNLFNSKNAEVKNILRQQIEAIELESNDYLTLNIIENNFKNRIDDLLKEPINYLILDKALENETIGPSQEHLFSLIKEGKDLEMDQEYLDKLRIESNIEENLRQLNVSYIIDKIKDEFLIIQSYFWYGTDLDTFNDITYITLDQKLRLLKELIEE
ncbi:MAG: hypothetical protein KatS3mg094_119 [Candidatus Parcubacteria bacterium]|nr:MAG: hypothetical protein KatS3mg094_119 [Candidatus Parcubacteria bacterium]